MKDELSQLMCIYHRNGTPQPASLAMIRTADDNRVAVLITEGTDANMVESHIRSIGSNDSYAIRCGLEKQGYKPINGAGNPLRAPNPKWDSEDEDASEYVSFRLG